MTSALLIPPASFRARLRRGAMGRRHRCIAVTSGHGGAGKSFLTANLAVALAERGERVLAVDCDFGLASLDLFFGVTPALDMNRVLSGQAVINDIVTETAEGVSLVPACTGRVDAANLDELSVQALFEHIADVADAFDTLVLDVPSGLSRASLALLSRADDVILVTTPDAFAMRSSYALLKALHRRSGIGRILTVANRAASNAVGVATFEEIERVVRRCLPLALEYIGHVPRSESAEDALALGRTLLRHAPSSDSAEAIRRFAARVSHVQVSESTC